MGLLRGLDRGFAKAEAAFIAAALAVMILSVFFDFLLRITMNSGLPWAKELAAFLMVWVGFLGASLATHRSRHLVLSLPEKIFPTPVRRWTSTAAGIITSGACLFLAWLSLRYTLETRTLGEISLTLGIPLWVVQTVIPAAFAATGLRFLGLTVHILRHGPVSLGDSGPAPVAVEGKA